MTKNAMEIESIKEDLSDLASKIDSTIDINKYRKLSDELMQPVRDLTYALSFAKLKKQVNMEIERDMRQEVEQSEGFRPGE